MVGASPATRLMAAVRSCTDWYGCLRSILAAMLLLAGFTLGVAYMGWSSYRLIVPCMHGRVRFRPFSTAHTHRSVPYKCMSFAADRRGKPGYTVDGGGTELYGLLRTNTDCSCRQIAVGGLYAVCCSPHTPGFVTLRRGRRSTLPPFSTVFYRSTPLTTPQKKRCNLLHRLKNTLNQLASS